MPPPEQLAFWAEWAKALGPAFVSALAVFVSVLTLRLSRQIAKQQADTAKQQADNALDQLNLFQKRYTIYEGAQKLIKLLVNKAANPDGHEVIQYYVLLDEAHFFFPKDVCDWLRTLREECQRLLIARSMQPVVASEIAAQTTHLVDLLAEMPQRFENELGFRHVTRRAPIDLRRRRADFPEHQEVDYFPERT
jgi:hypothetical protein